MYPQPIQPADADSPNKDASTIPYEGIADLLKDGKVVPFLGAGVNFGMRPSEKDEWKLGDPFLPSGSELSRHLAKMSNFPSEDAHDRRDLPKVSSYYADKLGRDPLRERLDKIFACDVYAPCTIHTYLAAIEKPLLIVTTNYDDLTEKAFINAGRPFYLVSHLTDRDDWREAVLWWKFDPDQPASDKIGPPVPPNELDRVIDLDTTVIYKMHGTADCHRVEWNSYVVTEDDYVDFLSRMTDKKAVPAMFMEHFNKCAFLFLGYGLRDWNLRVVLRDLLGNGKSRRRRSWAIQSRPSALERELWERRGVDIYDMDINKFIEALLSSAE